MILMTFCLFLSQFYVGLGGGVGMAAERGEAAAS